MNIVITGASRGLGKAIAATFAANGHHLFITSKNEFALYKTVEELILKYPDLTIKGKPFDLGIKQQAIAFGEWVNTVCQRVDVLVNNAGSFIPGSVHNEPDGALENLLQINLLSAYHVTRTILPNMMNQPLANGTKGHIFNVCSIASLKAYDNGGAYSISKFAMLGFSKNLREEMKPHAIKVTAVLPGAAYTDSWALSGIDPKRIMEANDVAQMIYGSTQLSAAAVVEDIVLRPQLGDV